MPHEESLSIDENRGNAKCMAEPHRVASSITARELCVANLEKVNLKAITLFDRLLPATQTKTLDQFQNQLGEDLACTAYPSEAAISQIDFQPTWRGVYGTVCPDVNLRSRVRDSVRLHCGPVSSSQAHRENHFGEDAVIGEIIR